MNISQVSRRTHVHLGLRSDIITSQYSITVWSRSTQPNSGSGAREENCCTIRTAVGIAVFNENRPLIEHLVRVYLRQRPAIHVQPAPRPQRVRNDAQRSTNLFQVLKEAAIHDVRRRQAYEDDLRTAYMQLSPALQEFWETDLCVSIMSEIHGNELAEILSPTFPQRI